MKRRSERDVDRRLTVQFPSVGFSVTTGPPFSTRVAPFSPRFGPSPQARVLLSE